MKTSEFKKLIEEAVNSQLREVLPEILDEYFSSLKQTKKPVVTEGKMPSAVNEIIDQMKDLQETPQQVPPKSKQAKKYTNNPIFNDILNETVCKIQPENSMGSGIYLSENMKSNVQSNIPVSTNEVEETPQLTQSNLTFMKDYSSLMETIKTKYNKK